ncbi:MAG: dockerin type I repeat-containing protein, partial [Clostridia bacterium]|nr:dockerin type I repeat-containing protein [Clostridia bacterium]
MKKLLSFSLCLMMILSAAIPALALNKNESYFDTVADNSFTVGDANDDGMVNAYDSVEMKKYCVGMSEVNADGSDINSDGTVNAKDLLILKKCHAGVDSISNYEDDNVVDTFTIAGNDISKYSIVYHEDSKYIENIYFSADTLRKYINIATGTNLNVGTEPVTEYKIEFVDVTTIPGMEEKLHIENYYYEVVDGNLFIYGTRRGSLYSVFEIAEDYLGYRFYSDEYVYMNDARVVDIPEGTESYREPVIEYRFSGQCFSRDTADSHFFPRRLNGNQLYGCAEEYRGTLTGPEIANAHSYDYHWRMATGRVDVNYDGTNGAGYYEKYLAGEQKDGVSWN